MVRSGALDRIFSEADGQSTGRWPRDVSLRTIYDLLNPYVTYLTTHSGLHGYTHEHVSTLTAKQERNVLTKSIEILEKFTGKKPKGWTAPAWETSRNSIQLLQEYGIVSYGKDVLALDQV